MHLKDHFYIPFIFLKIYIIKNLLFKRIYIYYIYLLLHNKAIKNNNAYNLYLLLLLINLPTLFPTESYT